METVWQWVLESLGGAGSIVSASPLQGGITATLHRVQVLVDGSMREVVLRQFTLKEWVDMQPDVAQHEAESLEWAQQVGVPVPQLIAYNENEVPAVLMTKLPGAVVLQPERMDVWLRQLAETLVPIHQVAAENYKRAYYSYNDVQKLHVPSWSDQPDVWQEALAIAQGPKPQSRLSLIHRDYHPANVLWQDGQVSGVVDWVNACRGPAGVDVGHCRLNLALLHGLDAADAFLDAYQQLAGEQFRYEPYWDLISLMDWLPNPPGVYQGWVDLGVTGLTDDLMRERYEALVRSVVEKARHSS